MSYKLFGIPNCDSVKKSRKHLDTIDIDFDFVDFKKIAPTKTNIKNWKSYLSELPVNKRGTTFRKFKEEFEETSEAGKLNLLIENSSAIKRPILEKNGQVVAIGWQEISKL